MPIFCQKSQFWAKFGPKILIILRGSKSSGTHRSENHLGALFALFFGRAQQQMDQKGRYLAQNGPICSFWAQFARFLGQNPIFFGQGSESFGTHISEKQQGTSFSMFFWVGHSTKMDQKGRYLAQMTESANFRPNLAISA